ncbi:sigma 54-interacting transcriptional regulator [Jhaorihella thermophila]
MNVEVTAAPIRLPVDGATVDCVIEVIRDLDRAVEISHQQRLSEIALLANGVAHEINTPLSSILLALDTIRRDLPEGCEAHEFTNLIETEIQTCMDVSESLMRLSLPSSDTPQAVDLSAVARDTLRLVRPNLEQAGIEARAEVPAELMIEAPDSDMRILLLNLVVNAIHAMPGGGKLAVRAARDGSGVVLEVADTGVGIPPENLKDIFLPFWTRRPDGSAGRGLGLAICRQVVERLGGDIEVESVPGKGTRFIVHLPDAEAMPPQGPRMAAAERAMAATQSILVVDDDAILRRLLLRQIEQLGFRAVGAGTLTEALAVLDTDPPDLVLLDQKLPDATSTDHLPDLAERCPVIVLTAHGSVDQAVGAVKAGAADYLTKPISPRMLELAIARVFEAARLRNEVGLLRREVKGQETPEIVGHTAEVCKLRERARMLAEAEMPVLIHGESGAGKRTVARFIHENGPRAEASFAELQCARADGSHLADELFGAAAPGLLEAARGGTLFLSDIGRMPQVVQRRLAAALETGAFTRRGSAREIGLQVRVIAASSQGLPELAAEGGLVPELFLHPHRLHPRSATAACAPCRHSRTRQPFPVAPSLRPRCGKRRSRERRSSCCRNGTGRATCANCATSSSAG